METQDDAEVVFLEEGLGVDAGGPGFFLLGVGDLFGEIELGDLVDHGAVLHGGCHGSLLSASAGKFTPFVAWMRCGDRIGIWRWILCADVCIYLCFACSEWQRVQDVF